jgi:hypothetical protein
MMSRLLGGSKRAFFVGASGRRRSRRHASLLDFEEECEDDDEHNRTGYQGRSLSLFIEVEAPWEGRRALHRRQSRE